MRCAAAAAARAAGDDGGCHAVAHCGVECVVDARRARARAGEVEGVGAELREVERRVEDDVNEMSEEKKKKRSMEEKNARTWSPAKTPIT